MKGICRLIGALMLILAIAVFVLFKLSGMRKLNGDYFIPEPLGAWAQKMVGHATGIKDETVVLFHELGVVKAEGKNAPAQSPADTRTQPAA